MSAQLRGLAITPEFMRNAEFTCGEALLDADSQPLASYPTSSPTPSLTTDSDGRHWITDHGLRQLPTEPMTWSNPVDFDATITTTIYPAPPT